MSAIIGTEIKRSIIYSTNATSSFKMFYSRTNIFRYGLNFVATLIHVNLNHFNIDTIFKLVDVSYATVVFIYVVGVLRIFSYFRGLRLNLRGDFYLSSVM